MPLARADIAKLTLPYHIRWLSQILHVWSFVRYTCTSSTFNPRVRENRRHHCAPRSVFTKLVAVFRQRDWLTPYRHLPHPPFARRRLVCASLLCRLLVDPTVDKNSTDYRTTESAGDQGGIREEPRNVSHEGRQQGMRRHLQEGPAGVPLSCQRGKKERF